MRQLKSESDTGGMSQSLNQGEGDDEVGHLLGFYVTPPLSPLNTSADIFLRGNKER